MKIFFDRIQGEKKPEKGLQAAIPRGKILALGIKSLYVTFYLWPVQGFFEGVRSGLCGPGASPVFALYIKILRRKSMREIYKKAKERMRGTCRLCPVCNGRACAGEVPGMGGLGTGRSFMANIEALTAYKLNMHCIHQAKTPDTSVDILGENLSFPVIAAPIGGVALNMGGQVTEAFYIDSLVDGCLAQGILPTCGDGVGPVIHEAGFATIKRSGGKTIPFIKPWESTELWEKFDKACAAGARIVGMDVDACGLISLALQGRPVSPKAPEELLEIIFRLSLPFIVKGVMTEKDALAAIEAGASAIVVSNHGGRVLDHTPGTAQVLPGIVKAVEGRAVVLVDGGVRTGVDILKMLALGADAVMIGRPLTVAAIGGGQSGVERFLTLLQQEFAQAMVLTGCVRVQDIGPQVLFKDKTP